MSMKEWKSLAKKKVLIAIIGLKIVGIGAVVGMVIMNIVRKFQKGENNE